MRKNFAALLLLAFATNAFAVTGVVDGQPVNAATTNAAFLGKNGDDQTTHKLGLADTDVLSGSSIANIQRELNAHASMMGASVNQAQNAKFIWGSDIVGTASDSIKARIEALVDKFSGSTGHAHSGVDGDGAKIDGANLTGTVGIAHGGTGQATANDALNALLPSQTGNENKALITDGSNSSWVKVASGGGSGGTGFNIIGIDSSWSLSSQDDRDLEQSVGNWTAYADSAATIPDATGGMTGGTPSTTCARTTTAGEVINGAGSLKMTVSSGATRQGEGCSAVTYVPDAYRGKTLILSFPFTATGTITDGDFIPYVYDVTNSKAVGASYFYSKLLGSRGQMIASFALDTTTAQIRYGIHIARASNTGAVNIFADDFSFSFTTVATGMAGSNWTSYSLSPSGLGTVTVTKAIYRQIGDSVQVSVDMILGAVAASQIQIPMPPGLSFKIPSGGNTMAGVIIRNNTQTGAYHLIARNGGTSFLVGLMNGSTSGLSPANGTIFSTGDEISFTSHPIPINGWDANVTMAQSAVTRMSSILANGSRLVGTAPSKLGDYRSYLRNAGSGGFTETNGAPATAPTVSDGIKIWMASTFAAGDAANQPSKYEIFIGKNLKPGQIQVLATTSTGFAGALDITPSSAGANGAIFATGIRTHYDPSTGILTLGPNLSWPGTVANMSLGVDTTGAFFTGPAYVEVQILQNALTVGIDSPPNAAYGITTAYAASAGGVVKFDTKSWDSHASYSTSTGLYTASRSGKWRVSGGFEASGTTNLLVAVNGTNRAYLTTMAAGNVYAASAFVSANAGDTISVTSQSAVTFGGGGAPFQNYLNIEWVSN